MDQRLTDALQRHPAVHDWTARRQVGRGVQIYLVGNQVENVRQIERESYEVEIFNDHQADGEPSRGAAKVPVSRADLADFLLKQLEGDTYVRRTPAIAC